MRCPLGVYINKSVWGQITKNKDASYNSRFVWESSSLLLYRKSNAVIVVNASMGTVQYF